MDNKMQIEISIKDNLSRQLAQMSENVKKAANVMKQQVSAIQEAFNNIKIKTDMSKQVNGINKEIDNIGKKTKSIQINIKARLDSSGLNGLNVQDKQVKVTPKVEELDLSEIENIKDKQVRITPVVDDMDLSEIENVKDKQVKVSPIVEELDLTEIENIKDKQVKVSPIVEELDLTEIENIKDKQVRIEPIVDKLDLTEIENIKDKQVKVSPIVEELDLTEINNIKDKQVRIEPIVNKLDLSEIENIKDKQVRVTPTVDKLDLSEINSIKDKQVKISVDVDDDKIEKVFKNIDVEIEDIEDDFGDLDIKSNILKQIKDIIKEFNNIGNKVKDVEIDIKADLDESELISDLRNFKGEINVEANLDKADLLSDLKDIKGEVNVAANTSGDSSSENNSVDFSDLLQLGATSEMTKSIGQINNLTGGMSENFKKLSVEQEKVFTEGIKGTEKYKHYISLLSNVYKYFLDIVTKPVQNAFDSKRLKTLNACCEDSISVFKLFKDTLKIPEAGPTITVFEELRNAMDAFQKTGDFSGLEELEEKIREIEELNKPLNLEVNVKDEKLVKLADDIVNLKHKIEDKELAIEFNTKALGNNQQDPIRSELLANKINKLKAQSAQLNLALFKTTSEFNRLTGAALPAGSVLNGLKATMGVLISPTSKLGAAFQKLKTKIDSTVGNASATFTKFKTSVNSTVDKVKTKLSNMVPEKVKNSFSTLKTVFSSWVPTLKNAGNKIKEFSNKMQDASKSTDKLKNSVGGLKGVLSKIGTFIGLYELIQFGKQAIETAANIEEAQNVIDVTFQKQANTINKWAKENASAFGLTELQAKNFAGTFGTIFQAAGVNMDYVDDMSIKLSQLAGDLASFRNLSVDDAFEKLRSGIVGSSEPLQNLGYNMSVAAMDAYLLSQGIDVAFSDLSEASKQVVRFNYIMQQTKSIQGDYANTMNSFSNSVRNLKNAFAVFSSEVGQTLIAALTPVIRVIATVIQWLTALARVFNSVLRGLGLIKGEASSAGAALGGVTSVGGGGGIGDVGGIEDTSGAIGGIGDSADDSAESVKKLAKEVKGLMGIDEINKLPAPEENDGEDGKGGKGGSGKPGDIGGGGVDVPIDLGLIPNIDDNYTGVIEDKIAEMMEKIKAYLATFDWEPLKESFMRLYESVKPFIERIGEAIKWTWEEILDPLIHFTVEDFLPRFFESLANILDILNPILEVVHENFKVLWDEVLEPIAKWTGDKFLDFWDWLNKHLKNFGDYLNENKTAAKILGDIATALLLMWGGSKVIAGGSKVINMIKNVITWVHHLFKFITGSSIVKALGSLFKGIGPAFSKVWGVITAAFGKIGPALSKVWSVISGLFAKIGPAFSKVWGVISGLFAKIGPALGKVWGVISGLFAKIGPLFTKLGGWLAKAGGLFTKLWGVLKVIGSAIMAGITAIATALNIPVAAVVAIIAAIAAAVAAIVIYWDEICAWCKKTWNKFTKWFSKTCKSIGKWFKELWADIKSVWNKVVDWFSNLFKKAWNGIKNAWSGVKKWFSNLWNGIKNIWKEVTQWFTNLFKKAWDGIKSAWSTVKKWFSDLWTGIKNIWKEVTQWFTNLFKNAWNGIKNAWSGVKKWFSDLWDGIKNIWKEVTQWFTNLFTNAWNGIKNAWSTVKKWFSDLWEGIKNVWKEVTQWFTNLFTNAWNGIKNAWSTVKNWFSDLWTGIKNIWKEVTQWFTNLFTNAWNGIKNAWSGVTNWFSSLWTGIKNVFSSVGTWFSNTFTSAWTGIKNAWSGVTNWFSGIWTGIKNAFSGVGTWFTNLFTNARDSIKNVWSNIKSFLTSPIESAKTAISNTIDKMKGLFNFNWTLPKIKLPHFSISPPGWEFGDLLKGSIPKLGIEWYADGGIMTNPTAFGVNGNNLMVGGEAGAEAIIPLNTLWEQMDKFANKIVQGTNTNNNRPIDIYNELFLDGNKVADSVIKNINKQTKLNGRSPLK